MALRIDLGSANLKGSFGFGKREDYTYDVPDGAIHVSLDAEDNSSDSPNIGSGNGKVTLDWDREEKKARVHAWVNGAAGSPNEVRWTVYAWIPYPGGEHKVTNAAWFLVCGVAPGISPGIKLHLCNVE